MLCTWNSDSDVCHLYLNKTGAGRGHLTQDCLIQTPTWGNSSLCNGSARHLPDFLHASGPPSLPSSSLLPFLYFFIFLTSFLLCVVDTWYCVFGASLVAQTVKLLPTMWETQVRSLGRKIPWRRKQQPTPVFMPGKSHGPRSLVGYSPWGRKELDTERLHFIVFQVHSIVTSILFRFFSLLQDIEYSSWCYTVNPCCFSICCMHEC